jgi:hypothetical protein
MFCIIFVDISSTPMQVMRMPPDIVSIRMVHRGIIMPIPLPGMLIGAPIAGMPIVPASIIMLTIVLPR